MLTIQEAMRKAREAAGYTQKGLSCAAGLWKNAVCTYESGMSAPGLYAIIALADTLGISIDEYVGHQIKKVGRRKYGPQL